MSAFGDKLRAALTLRCAGKQRYETLEVAERFARKRTRPGARNRARLLQAYACPDGCGGFHLTSRPYREKVELYPVIGDWPA